MPTNRNLSWLRLAREAAGLTQGELGELIGRTQPVVSHYEDGLRIPSAAVAKRIGNALGVDGARLFSAAESSPVEVIHRHLASPSENHRPNLASLDVTDVSIMMDGPQAGTIEYLNRSGRLLAYETANRMVIIGAQGLPNLAAVRAAPQGSIGSRERRTRRSRRSADSRGAPDDGPGEPAPGRARQVSQRGRS